MFSSFPSKRYWTRREKSRRQGEWQATRVSECALEEASDGNDSDQTKKDQVAIGPQGANKSRSKLQPKRRSVELKQASQLRRDDGKISR